jgi:hypothetical protein
MKGTWQATDSGGGSGGLVLIAVIVVVALGSGAASAAASALVTLLIIAAAVIGVAVLGGVAVLIYRTRSERPRRPIAAPAVSPLPPESRPQLEGSHKPAIEPPRNELHLHFHGMTPAEAAEAIRTAIPGTAGE